MRTEAEQTAPAVVRPAWLQAPVLAAVACGGAIGAAARYGIDVLLPTSTHGFPASTYLINVSGSLLLGLLYTVVQARFPADRLIRAFFGTGVLGAYTTYSTYMVETVLLTRGGYPGLSALYLFGSVVAGLLAAVLAVALGRRIVDRS